MPNNLIFNYSAEELKVLSNGADINGVLRPLQVNNEGALNIGSIDGTVSISATELDIRALSGATDSILVSGDVSVVATELDIRALSGATDSVLVSGDVSVVATALDIRGLSGATDSVVVSGFSNISELESLSFASGQTINTLSRLVGVTSFMTYYINNTSTGTLTVNYQMAPVDQDSYYINDALVPAVTINSLEKGVILQGTYSTYGRLSITCTDGDGEVEVYYMSRA